MLPSKLKSYLKFHGDRVNRALNQYLPKVTARPSRIHEAMRYSVNAGGKRLRPILVIAAAEACGGKLEHVMPTACALELIHTYSLIHDDLPALDNDDLRRGLPTSHKKFGEDIAILAGDALLTYAFQLIAKNADMKGVSSKAVLEVLKVVSSKAGTCGMIGGQVADIQADKGRWKKKLDRQFSNPSQLLTYIHLNKTSALIQASLLAGGHLAGATRAQIRALEEYGRHIGLAFQITDDVLDVIGNKKKLGKKGSDRTNQKLTYSTLYGLESSKKQAVFCIQKSIKCLNIFKKRADTLRELAFFILHRDH